jgi:hypothetical protein
MQAKSGFWIIALVLLSFLAVGIPHQVCAQTLPPPQGTDPITIKATQPCDDLALDTAVQTQNTAFNQKRMTIAQNVNLMFPQIPALGQCVQTVMNLFTKIGSANPLSGLTSSILTGIINQVVSQACSAVTSQLTAITSAVSNLVKVCLPMPQFNLTLDSSILSGLGLNSPLCASGSNIPLGGSSFNSNPVPAVNYQTYQSR